MHCRFILAERACKKVRGLRLNPQIFAALNRALCNVWRRQRSAFAEHLVLSLILPTATRQGQKQTLTPDTSTLSMRCGNRHKHWWHAHLQKILKYKAQAPLVPHRFVYTAKPLRFKFSFKNKLTGVLLT